MILADKIINERKKCGWSQEELADRLNVSRQSVSKWESAQSVPDMQRIVEMSRIFNVSTDYLLKDEMEDEGEKSPTVYSDAAIRRVSLEEAQRFLAARHDEAPKVAQGVFLCILGAAMVVLLAAIGEYGILPIGEDACGAIGIIFLLICIAVAVALFIKSGQRLSPYEYLEKEQFEIEYGVAGLARERKELYSEKYGRFIGIGVVLCILSVIPMLAASIKFGEGFVTAAMVSVLLLFIAVAVVLFIIYGMNMDSVSVLLQEGDYTAMKKKQSSVIGRVCGIYWLVITAAYLLWSFSINNWNETWIIWPVAGVLCPVVIGVTKLIIGDKE